MSDRIRIEWSYPSGSGSRLTCPDCPDLDVKVSSGREGAAAVAAHLESHNRKARR